MLGLILPIVLLVLAAAPPADRGRIIVFAESGFPAMDVLDIPAIEGATEARTTDELAEALAQGGVFVWRHGSTFPTEAWPALKRFLEAGGAMVYLGGEPFTRPCVPTPHGRVTQPRSLAMLKTLRLNQCHRVDTSATTLGWKAIDHRTPPPPRVLPQDAWAAVLEPRFTDSQDYPDEEGSPGPREAVMRAMAHLTAAEDPGFPVAAAAVAIDHLQGRWAGGRWVFWLSSEPPTAAELDRMIAVASESVAELRIAPRYACFHEGERPGVTLGLHRPRATDRATYDIALQVTNEAGAAVDSQQVNLVAGERGEAAVSLKEGLPPGLYRVMAEGRGLPRAENGFWVFDPARFASGEPVTFDSRSMRRGGRAEFVLGTTVMSRDTHRRFLNEPNVADWDDTFRELAAIDFNMVRTGVWSGWREISPSPGVVDEGWMRALEAYYLTARRHDIPVMFTFFAFTPHAFGGDNPYFDPRALDGQKAWLSAVAKRFAPAKQIIWDLINEPSFSSPKKLWKCRPHGDMHEARAFREWLTARFRTDEAVRARWRLAPDEAIGLPTDADFEDRHVFGDAHPYRAADYIRFAQHAFGEWASAMSGAIRSAGSAAAITVGQDEGGLTQRPSPLLHHDRVDFTSMHTWWFNDRLLWDTLMAKAPGRALLISETGVMNHERLSGEAMRTPQDAADLLSRKIGYAFAGGACGVVQWCYDVNPYMASDNEVAIGLRRVDGSYKPEHRVMREFAGFFARNRERLANPTPADAHVVVIAPLADAFTPRDGATAATQRAIQSLFVDLRTPLRVVADERIAQDLGRPKAIILPACTGLTEDSWRVLMRAVEDTGATLICSGYFEADDAGLPARRLGTRPRALMHVEPMPTAAPAAPAAADRRIPTHATFDRTVTESRFAAAGEAGIRMLTLGGGRIIHHALPVEWAAEPEVTTEFYRYALAEADVRMGEMASGLPGSEPGLDSMGAGFIIRPLELWAETLIIAVNESSQTPFVSAGGMWGIHVPRGTARFVILRENPRNERIEPIDASHTDDITVRP
jgi:hypothetical protein